MQNPVPYSAVALVPTAETKRKGVVKNSEIMNDKLFTKLRSRGARVLPDVLNCYDMDELKIKCFISEN